MVDIGFQDNPELWPWVLPYATNAINSCFNEKIQDTPINSYKRRMGLEKKVDQFAFGDVVLFKYGNEKVSEETWVNGTREGIFLNYNHSGSANVVCLNNQRVARFEVHPSQINHGDDSKRKEIIHKLRWGLGKETNKINIEDFTEFGKAYENSDNEDFPEKDETNQPQQTETPEECTPKYTVMSRRQRKLLIKALRSHSNELTGRRTQHKKVSRPKEKRRVRVLKQMNQSSRMSHEPQMTFTFSDGCSEYVLSQSPLKGVAVFSEIIDNRVSDNSFVMNMNDVPKERTKAVIATVKGQKQVIRYGRYKKKNTGRYHPEIGYIAEDEAEPDDVLNGLFREADLKEWNSIIDNCVLEEADEQYSKDAIRTRFRRTYKTVIGPDGCTNKQPKTRFLVCAYNDNRPVDTTTYVPSAQSRRLAAAFGLFRGWRAATIDIKTAFLLVTLTSEEPIHIMLPNKLPQYISNLGYKPGGIYKLKRALYGLKESPKLFNEFLAKELKELGWKKIFDGIFVRYAHRPILNDEIENWDSKQDISGILTAYVDDLLLFSEDPIKDLNVIAKHIKCSDLLPVNENKQRHVGYEVFGDAEHVYFDMQGYVESMD